MLFVADMTILQIESENTQMTNDLYRLLKKYSGLRNLIRELKVCWDSSVIFVCVKPAFLFVIRQWKTFLTVDHNKGTLFYNNLGWDHPIYKGVPKKIR